MNYLKCFSSMLMVVLLSLGCKKSFLENTPKKVLIATTTHDYELMINSESLANIYLSALLPLGDEITSMNPFYMAASVKTKRLFQYEDKIYEDNEDAGELDATLQQLYTYNKIIDEVMESQGGSEQQKKSIRAEALVGRAFNHFMLVNLFGQPYYAETADSDLGFPILDKANVTQTTFMRNSVGEVYDFIVNDLESAIPDLPASIVHRYRVGKPTAQALLAKVYVFMGKFQEAIPLLDAALDGLAGAKVPMELYDYNIELQDGGEFYPIGFFGPELPSSFQNHEVVWARQTSNAYTYQTQLFIGPKTAALYLTSDLRINYFLDEPWDGGESFPEGFFTIIGPISAQMGVVIPELYLLRAECHARLGEAGRAVADVELLRKHRMSTEDAKVPVEIASNQKELVKFILNERIREFAGQGYRWFDMRRLSVDPVFKGTVDYKHEVYHEDGDGIDASYELRPERLTLRLPRKILNANPDMEDNP